jgi:hypothetical protein
VGIGDRFEDNLNPDGGAYHACSMILCPPTSSFVRGFNNIRWDAGTPFNLRLEDRP